MTTAVSNMKDGSPSHQFCLLPLTREMYAAMDSVDRFTEFCGAQIKPEQLTHLRPLVEQSLAFYDRIAATQPWTGYLAVTDEISEYEMPAIVGLGGFKGNPDAESAVEIAYHTLPEYESRGIGTRLAAELVNVAKSGPDVQRVMAHTLPKRNASCRILERNNFECEGEVEDPEDGTVWRWQLRV